MSERIPVRYSNSPRASPRPGGLPIPQHSPGGRSNSQSELTMSRVHEKQQLVHLNDRLAAYIDRVRQLETENRQLQVYISRVEEQLHTQHKTVRVSFDQELQRIYDTLGKENEKLKNQNDIMRPELEKMKNRIIELQQFNHDSEKARIAAESLVRELGAKQQGLEDEKNMWEREAMSVQAENQNLNQKRQELEDLLAQERQLRLNAEKRVEDLLKDFEQYKAEHEKSLEAKHQEYIEKLEITRKELTGQHEAQLQDALIKLRNEMNEQLAQSRKPIQDMYEKKLNLLTAELENFRRDSGEAAAQLQKLYAQTKALEKDRGALAERVHLLEQDNAKLQNELRSALARYDALLQQAEAERRALEREIEDLMQQYADLMDAKVQLHNEIATYRNLLESEESRLRMHQQHPQQQPTTMIVKESRTKYRSTKHTSDV